MPLLRASLRPADRTGLPARPGPSSQPARLPGEWIDGATVWTTRPRAASARPSWKRWVFPAVWLLYLVQTVSGLAAHTGAVGTAAGLLVLAVFCAVYLVALPVQRPREFSRMVAAVAALCLLTGLEAVGAHGDAFVMCVYIAVLAVAGLGRSAPVVVAALTAAAAGIPALVPSWHSRLDWGTVIAIPMAAVAMYGFFAIIGVNRELSAARAEVARLAADNERNRIARDLHDLLGHSLTTITVKAELARRLAAQDPARAAQEIGEVEELSRSALRDVRAAVAGYREVSLAGEVAGAAAVLRAAGIEAQLPRALDVVAPRWHELFGWAVREGVTNVVRHSRARTCTIVLGPDWLELRDDGASGASGVSGDSGDSGVSSADNAAPAPSGSGLAGLRERVEAAGGRLASAPVRAGGWCLRVDMADQLSATPVDPDATAAPVDPAATVAPA